MSHPSQSTALSLLRMSLGFIVWSSCFVVLYGGHALACRFALNMYSLAGISGVTLLLAALWVVHLAVLAWLVVDAARWARAFQTGHPLSPVPSLTLILDGSALVATIWIGFPVLLLPPCA